MLIRRWMTQRRQRRLIAEMPAVLSLGLKTRDWDYIPEIMLGLEQFWQRDDNLKELRQRSKQFKDEVERLLGQLAGRMVQFQASREISHTAPAFDPPRQIEGVVHRAYTSIRGRVELIINDEINGQTGYTVATGTPILITTQLRPEILWAASRLLDDERQLWYDAEQESWDAHYHHWNQDNVALATAFAPWLEKLVRLEAVKLRYWHDPYSPRCYSRNGTVSAHSDKQATDLVVGKLVNFWWWEGEASNAGAFHGFCIYNPEKNRREFYEITRETSVTEVTEAAWEHSLPLELSIQEA